jgi:hypothetical protein
MVNQESTSIAIMEELMKRQVNIDKVLNVQLEITKQMIK